MHITYEEMVERFPIGSTVRVNELYSLAKLHGAEAQVVKHCRSKSQVTIGGHSCEGYVEIADTSGEFERTFGAAYPIGLWATYIEPVTAPHSAALAKALGL